MHLLFLEFKLSLAWPDRGSNKPALENFKDETFSESL